MTDHYAVIGNPVDHSLSPVVHAAFARQTGQDLSYIKRFSPLTGFAATLRQFQAEGGCGVNVTVPFKEEAWRMADKRTARAELAQAANTLTFTATGILADNTDGAGLITDLQQNRKFQLEGQRILVLGAGGAARGVLSALLAERPNRLVIANRTVSRAHTLQERFAPHGNVSACDYAALQNEQFDCVINATSTGLSGESIALPDNLFAAEGLAYDMAYGKDSTPFLQFAQSHGAAHRADGLGMLVEQAAEAFYLWRKVRPQTQTVIARLRSGSANRV